MKKSIYFFLGVLIFAIACGDDEPDPLSEQILGTWTATQNVTASCVDTAENATIEITCDSLNCYKLIISDSLLVEFRIVNGDSSNTTRNWHLVSDLIEICDSDAPDATCNDRRVSIDDNRLRLTAPTDEDGCDFTEVFSRG